MFFLFSGYTDLKINEIGALGGSVICVSDFSSGHELAVSELEPCVVLGSTALSVLIAGLEPGSDSVSPSLSAPPLLVLSLYQKLINIKKIKNK